MNKGVLRAKLLKASTGGPPGDFPQRAGLFPESAEPFPGFQRRTPERKR
jgi:hypothetical protein